MITPEMKYTASFDVASYCVDSRRRLKAPAFMDFAQEMAYRAAEAMHFGFSDLAERGVLWVLSRFEARIARMPVWNDTVGFATWCKQPEGPFFMRDFRMSTPLGEVLAEATSAWSVIDLSTRRLLRGEEILSLVDPRWNCADAAFDRPAAKVAAPRRPDAWTPAATHRVAYSDIDVNGHANNARYLAWAMDLIPEDFLAARRPARFAINFNRECRPGEEIALLTRHDDGADTWLVAGTCQGEQKFVLELEFAPAGQD